MRANTILGISWRAVLAIALIAGPTTVVPVLADTGADDSGGAVPSMPCHPSVPAAPATDPPCGDDGCPPRDCGTVRCAQLASTLPPVAPMPALAPPAPAPERPDAAVAAAPPKTPPTRPPIG